MPWLHLSWLTFIRVHLSSECIWVYWGAFEFIKVILNLFDFIRVHLSSFMFLELSLFKFTGVHLSLFVLMTVHLSLLDYSSRSSIRSEPDLELTQILSACHSIWVLCLGMVIDHTDAYCARAHLFQAGQLNHAQEQYTAFSLVRRTGHCVSNTFMHSTDTPVWVLPK